MPSIFISSCTRRQLARRRPSRGMQRLQIQLWLVPLLGTVIGVVLTVRGVI
jgi:hypothetical protein